MQKTIKDFYEHVYVRHLFSEHSAMFNAGRNTLETFTWAALTVWGRAFSVGDSNGPTEYAIIPIGDLLNHR